MIPEIGQFALIIALMLALTQAILPMIGAARGNRSWMAVAAPAGQAQFIFVAIAFCCLAYSFITNDFSVLNVATNSNSQVATSLPAGGYLGIPRRFAAALGLDARSLDRRCNAFQPASS